jgi:hypothetical protein
MFTAEAAAAHFREQALTVNDVTVAVGDRIVNLSLVPQGVALPALLHYAEFVNYTGPTVTEYITSEIRYVCRFVCKGESTQPIAAAAEALRLHMNGNYGEFGGFQFEWEATGEWPITTVAEGGDIYRMLGVYFRVIVNPTGA